MSLIGARTVKDLVPEMVRTSSFHVVFKQAWFWSCSWFVGRASRLATDHSETLNESSSWNGNVRRLFEVRNELLIYAKPYFILHYPFTYHDHMYYIAPMRHVTITILGIPKNQFRQWISGVQCMYTPHYSIRASNIQSRLRGRTRVLDVNATVVNVRLCDLLWLAIDW